MPKKSRKNLSKWALCIVTGNALGAKAGTTPETATKRLAGRATQSIR